MRGLESILSGAAKPEPETPDGDDLGPCASRPAPKGWPGRHIFNGREDTCAFHYHHLGLERFAADGASFVFEWNVPEKEERSRSHTPASIQRCTSSLRQRAFLR